MINNLQFIVSHHPQRASPIHTGYYNFLNNNEKYLLREIAFVQMWPHLTKPRFADDHIVVGSSLWNWLPLALHSDSFYARLNYFAAVLCSGAALSSSLRQSMF